MTTNSYNILLTKFRYLRYSHRWCTIMYNLFEGSITSERPSPDYGGCNDRGQNRLIVAENQWQGGLYRMGYHSSKCRYTYRSNLGSKQDKLRRASEWEWQLSIAEGLGIMHVDEIRIPWKIVLLSRFGQCITSCALKKNINIFSLFQHSHQ